jgi:hypothetical protein
MDNHERIIVQLQVDVLHDISNGIIQIHEPPIVPVGENSNMEIVVLARSLRIGRKHMPLNPVVELLQGVGQYFRRIGLRSRLHDDRVVG